MTTSEEEDDRRLKTITYVKTGSLGWKLRGGQEVEDDYFGEDDLRGEDRKQGKEESFKEKILRG